MTGPEPSALANDVQAVLADPRVSEATERHAQARFSTSLARQYGSSLVQQMLADQQRLTAVERFSQRHSDESLPAQTKFYSTLLPASPPRMGEQYAFEVDLDACSGCKSCVTACHAMNGLDENEAWRDVGLLHGGSAELPVIQHVTAACHHCLEPACMTGCPVQAYEKDPVTGIVRHLDDQCIGCQYCTLACPYDVPKYNPRLGIVRKCDMCSSRLAVGEAPACVQGCPNGSIRITVVRQHEVVESCETGQFLPSAPDPAITLPTTNYKTRRALPRNLLPADYYSINPEHAHWPLVVMLVLTQLSVGAFLVAMVLQAFARPELLADVSRVHAASALVFGLLALGASVFHLGRPHLAFRAVIGLGTSWLSREILAFGVFAVLATTYAVVAWFGPNCAMLDWVAGPLLASLGWSVVFAGMAGIGCSIMIYRSTHRRFWSGTAASVKFLLTTLVLGVATTLVTSVAAAAGMSRLRLNEVWGEYGASLVRLLVAAAGMKLLVEVTSLRHFRAKQNSPARRSAMLMIGPLARTTAWRFICGALGGVVLPAFVLAQFGSTNEATRAGALVGMLILLSFVACVIGELLERFLFFTAVVAPRMPGRLSP
jgi:Fe-S-cluster-containing dehydrogenase component/DMSO reductase anchor subunit